MRCIVCLLPEPVFRWAPLANWGAPGYRRILRDRGN